MTTENQHNNSNNNRRGIRAGRSSTFKAFRALRMMRPDQAVNHLSSVPERFSTSAALSALRQQHMDGNLPTPATGGHHLRGRKRLAAKKALKALYHNLVTPILPIALVVSGAFSEGNATVSRTLMHTIANSPANALSRWFGKFAGSHHVPRFVHQKMISMMIRVYGIDTSQIEKPISQYGSLQEFFSRRLVPDARPAHPSALLTSPADCELLRCGEVMSGMMVQVKGNEYPLTDLIGVPMKDAEAGNRRWFFIFHLRPKDYHRFHAPCDAVIHETIHMPGLLLPVTKTCANWVPNLFSELERVSMVGHLKNQKHRQFAMVPMGATCVGSISLAFDPRIQTNKTSSWTNFFSLFNWNKEEESRLIQEGLFQRMNFPSFLMNGSSSSSSDENEKEGTSNSNNNKTNNSNGGSISGNDNNNNSVDNDDDDDDQEVLDDDGDEAEDIQIEFVPPRSPLTQLSEYGQRKGKRTIYAPSKRPQMEKGKEIGWFNWGSAIIVVADLPDGYEPIVKAMENLRVGQALVAPTGRTSTAKLAAD